MATGEVTRRAPNVIADHQSADGAPEEHMFRTLSASNSRRLPAMATTVAKTVPVIAPRKAAQTSIHPRIEARAPAHRARRQYSTSRT